MKWALIILAIVLVAAGIVLLIGSRLPVAHVATMRATYRQSPDAVWSAITNVAAYPSWRSDVKRIEVLTQEPGRMRWVEDGSDGRITFEVVESTPTTSHVVRIADPDLPFGGSWTYTLTPTANGTELRITERGEVRNALYRFMSRFVLGHTATIEKYLAALGAHFGEVVTPAAG